MTDTAAKPATAGRAGTPTTNQAGARINRDAFAEAEDFLPLDGIDHVEFWVGNARQASAYFRALWGFTPIAFSGLETGVRDRASYVMRQHDITIALTAPGAPRRAGRPAARAPARPGPRRPAPPPPAAARRAGGATGGGGRGGG